MPLIVPAAAVPQQPAARASAPAKQSKAQSKSPIRKVADKAGVADLAAFFRKPGAQPALLERFSTSPASRAQVLAGFNLSHEHTALLVQGRVQETTGALLRSACTLETCTVSISDSPDESDQLCNHADCKAFRIAAKSV